MAFRTARARSLGLVLAPALLVGTPAPTLAAPLLADLADRTLTCAVDPPYYIGPQSETLTTLRFSEVEGAPWEDITVALAPPALQPGKPERMELLLPLMAGQAKQTRLVFIRAPEPPQPGAGNRKPRLVISLHMDGDGVGDECVVKKGRTPYVESRFNTVRESVCGNDPAPSCETLLAKTCGAEPTYACTKAAVPALDQASKAYFDAQNATAGKPGAQGK